MVNALLKFSSGATLGTFAVLVYVLITDYSAFPSLNVARQLELNAYFFWKSTIYLEPVRKFADSKTGFAR